MRFTVRTGRRRLAAGLLLGGLAAAGCGGKKTYPVEGQVVVKGGGVPAEALAGYVVTFESEVEKVGATGSVGKDGTFRMTTTKNGDGAVAGKHRVSLIPETWDAKMVLPSRYHRLETSGLEVTVEPRTNEITLEVEPRTK
jgi:hypothetical protein